MKWVSLVGGPVLGAMVWCALWWCGLGAPACWTGGVTALCAVWWVGEPVPIAGTALVPFAVFPLAGVLTHEQVAGAYGHTLIMLFLGGFILSGAMEKSGTHRRVAMGIVRVVGSTSGRRLVLGFMLGSAGLSMWISNTATVLMLLPIMGAVLEKVRDCRLAVALTLGVAYAGSIGGLGTPIGSPPNVIFMGVYQEVTGVEVSFLGWMKVGIPVVLVLLPLAWLWLTRSVRGVEGVVLEGAGPWRWAEVGTLVVFGVTALGWVTRTTPYGGWSAWCGMPGAGDSTVALLAAVVLFVVPDGEGGRLMDWETAKGIPWGLLVLFGGGLAIARGFGESGLNEVVGEALSGMMGWSTLWMVLALCLVVTFLTEVTSNTATATMLMPILGAAGLAGGINPALVMIPAALSASCAFMLPVATPPNAIVFGTGRVTIREMAGEGLVLNLLGAGVITGVCLWVVGG